LTGGCFAYMCIVFRHYRVAVSGEFHHHGLRCSGLSVKR
jgi:hypothetical protein